jgi:NADH-quinone oxidoreductase subunit H
VAIDLLIGAVKAIVILLLVLQLSALLLWFERKGSALIQDRVGANRASLTGFGKRIGLPNLGLVTTLMADPLKLFTKEDFVPEGADKFVHALGPFLALFPVLVTFAVVPIGDSIQIAGRTVQLQAATISVGALYILATIGVGVYGVALGGWASNNRFALLGGVRATAQMISYEIAMGLAIISMVITFGTLDLQDICRQQGGVWFGFLPRWGIFLQPLAFFILLTAGMAESKRVPFDLPEGESELVAGYFTEYSGGKQACFMLTDFAEVVLIATLLTLFFFGGWQFPWLYPDGFHLGAHAIHLPRAVVVIAGLLTFWIKTLLLCWLQILIRWSVPRFRYDQLMRLGWKGLVPIGLLNVLITAFVVVLANGAAR